MPTSEQAIELLTGLVSVYSPSGQERPAVDYLAEAMGAYGLRAEVDAAGNAVGTIGEGERELLLLGHIDTVPGEIAVRREGHLLHGRGAVDAKGPLAAFAVAAARAGALPGLRVTVVGAVEEEAATSKGAYYIVGHHPRPAAAIIGEPSAWDRVTLGYKGRLLIEYERTQPMAHSAGQGHGVCEEAVAFWNELAHWCAGYNADREGRFATADPSLRSIHSESDGLYERVAMTIGVRLPPEIDVPALVDALDAWADEARVTTRGFEQPYRASRRTPLTSAFLATIRAAGGTPAFVNKTGTSDMNVLGAHWDCPLVAYGPGDSSLDHTPQEHIDLDEYLRSIDVLEAVIRRMAVVKE
jgi:LysW-gamma-L-lysine carboxypeptidase